MMSKEATALQHDMFTGNWVDTRSRRQKEVDASRNDWMQMNMFSIQEAPIGLLRAKPVADISNLPSPPLLLTCEDPRTDEEKAADLHRETQALTVNMFGSEPGKDIEQVQRVEDKSDEKVAIQHDETQDTKLMAYLGLIQVMQEQITTTWIDENYKQIFDTQLPLSILNAIEAGLTSHEVTDTVGELI